jgi:hypothetical protein
VCPVIDYRKSNLLKTRENLLAGHRAPLGLRFRALLFFLLRALLIFQFPAIHHELERVVLVALAIDRDEHADHARRVIIGARLVRVARIVEIADLAKG